jgi:cell division protein FtsN
VLGSRDLWGDLKRLLEFGFSGTNPPTPGADIVEAAVQKDPSAAIGDGDADDAPGMRATQQYAVQLGTFQQFKAATRLKTAMAAKGFSVRIEKLHQGRRRLYRVAVGNYADRAAARRAAERLKKSAGHLSPVIVTAS